MLAVPFADFGLESRSSRRPTPGEWIGARVSSDSLGSIDDRKLLLPQGLGGRPWFDLSRGGSVHLEFYVGNENLVGHLPREKTCEGIRDIPARATNQVISDIEIPSGCPFIEHQGFSAFANECRLEQTSLPLTCGSVFGE